MIYSSLQKNKGYTLLFAVLVSSLVLSVGISILNISRKEFLLSSSARESTSAFYAADSALECAVYQDDRYDRFSAGNFLTGAACNNTGNIAVITNSPSGVYTFDVNLNDISCAKVTVTKYAVGNPISTSIESRGYNIGANKSTDLCNRTSPKKVERALYYSY